MFGNFGRRIVQQSPRKFERGLTVAHLEFGGVGNTHSAIGTEDCRFQFDPPRRYPRQRRDRTAARSPKPLEQAAFRSDFRMTFRVINTSQQFARSRIATPAFDPDRGLRRSRQPDLWV